MSLRIAKTIDYTCKIVFPLAFVVFIVFYYKTYYADEYYHRLLDGKLIPYKYDELGLLNELHLFNE